MKITIQPKQMETMTSRLKKQMKVDDKKIQDEIHRAIRRLVRAYPNWNKGE